MKTPDIQTIQQLVFEMASHSHREQLADGQSWFGTLESIEEFVRTSGFEWCETPQEWAQEYIDAAPEDEDE